MGLYGSLSGALLLCSLSVMILLCLLSPVERASKSLDEILSTGGGIKMPVENRPGDPAILKVIEAYCVSNKGIAHTRKYFCRFSGTCVQYKS